MAKEPTAKMVNVRLTGTHLVIFEELCKQDERTMASMVRYLILKEYQRRMNTPVEVRREQLNPTN